MSDTRPLSERVADILATEDCVVTPLLREQQEEIAKLNRYLCDAELREAALEDALAMRGNMIRQMEGYIEGFRRDLEAARVDAERYRWLREHTVAAGLGQFIRQMRKRFLDAAVDAARARGEG